MPRLYLLVLLLLPLMQGVAQSYRSRTSQEKQPTQYPIPNQFEHLSVKDGLSNSSVNCILQDRDGYMWFGTNEGLNKYDGYTFTVFQPDPDQPTRSFHNGHITGMCEGISDELWVITEGGGLHEVNRKTGLVTPHPIKAPKANRWNNQISAYKDSQNIIWITTFAGLASYEPKRHLFTLYPAPNPEWPVKTVFEDRQHRFWVATHQGLYLFDRPTGRFTPVLAQVGSGPQPSFMSFYLDNEDVLWIGTASAGHSLFQLNLRQQPWKLVPYNPGGQLNPYVWRNTMHRDAMGIIWVGTTNGLQGIDPITAKVYTYRPDPVSSKSISSNNAQAVYHDRTGMLWIGTDNGIDRQAVNTKPFETYRVVPNERMASIDENRVNALLKDNRGRLWFSNFATVYRTSANNKQLEIIPPSSLGSTAENKNFTYCFFNDGSDDVWLGTNSGLYRFDQLSGEYKKYPTEFFIQFIDRAPNGELWVGGEGGIASFNEVTHKYTYYTYKEGDTTRLIDKYVHGVLASRTGDVWVLIKQMGVCRLNPKTGRFTRYTDGPKGHLSSNDVQSIYEDKEGVIWIGTHLGGLNRFDPKTGLFSVITHQDGIPGNSVLAITSDESGHIWLSTDDGLCRVDPKTKAIHRYELTDGLPSNIFLPNAVFRQPNQLFFGSTNGIVYFNPDRIRDNTRPFPVYINELTVLDKPRAITDSIIRLNHDENMLSFGFAALAYEQPDQNQFAYQLVGVNKDWVQSGNRHFATYTNLSPGTYTFRVKAANSDGFWTKNEAAVQVIVQPPWWATWWAYGLYALMAGGAVWAYIRFYTNRIRQQQELDLNRRQAEQLKAVDELKTRFFSNITHEFRTPLSLIISPVEKLLQESRFDRPMLTLVHRNAEQLLRLINQLLDLSKLEANYMAISVRQGNVTEFVQHMVEVFRRAAEQKGITLTCVIDKLPAQEYLFDADKWEKILTNLLSNAMKFTPAGGQVALTISPVWAGAQMTGVQIEVADTGIGIASDKLPHIFDRFYQVDASSTRAYEGTGIGLSLVNELVSLLGGTIAAESELTVGTTFRLTLPVGAVLTGADIPRVTWAAHQQADAPLPAPEPAPVTNGFGEQHQGPRILIVEDNDELREFLVGELASSYTILQAVDGQAGWETAQTELPDIVLTDVMMPRMDGNELTRLIKGHPETDHIAVVMLTAKAAQQSRIDGLQHGADDYLSKPFSVDELHLRLHNLISRQQKLGDHYRQQFALPASQHTPNLGELNNDPFLHRIYELLEQHLDDSSISVDWLAEQLSMSRKTLYRKVHSLIQLPPADLIRQYRLRKAAELLEAGHTVAEAADLVGFKTPSHFALVFKDFYQQTPSDFMDSRVNND